LEEVLDQRGIPREQREAVAAKVQVVVNITALAKHKAQARAAAAVQTASS
jgi:hypothetical protein